MATLKGLIDVGESFQTFGSSDDVRRCVEALNYRKESLDKQASIAGVEPFIKKALVDESTAIDSILARIFLKKEGV